MSLDELGIRGTEVAAEIRGEIDLLACRRFGQGARVSNTARHGLQKGPTDAQPEDDRVDRNRIAGNRFAAHRRVSRLLAGSARSIEDDVRRSAEKHARGDEYVDRGRQQCGEPVRVISLRSAAHEDLPSKAGADPETEVDPPEGEGRAHDAVHAVDEDAFVRAPGRDFVVGVEKAERVVGARRDVGIEPVSELRRGAERWTRAAIDGRPGVAAARRFSGDAQRRAEQDGRRSATTVGLCMVVVRVQGVERVENAVAMGSRRGGGESRKKQDGGGQREAEGRDQVHVERERHLEPGTVSRRDSARCRLLQLFRDRCEAGHAAAVRRVAKVRVASPMRDMIFDHQSTPRRVCGLPIHLVGAALLGALACDADVPHEGKQPGSTALPLGKADAGLAVDDRGTIAFEQSLEHVAIDTGEYHGYRFEARSGACIDVALSAEVKKEPDTYLFVLQRSGADWTILEEDDDGGKGLDSEIQGLVLSDGGEYQLVATSYQAEGNGSYELSLSCCNGACEPEPEICKGGTDEDGDGDVDCDDSDCEGAPECDDSGDGEESCTNGIDDEGDGLTDCWDVDSCFSHPACAGRPGRLGAAWEDTVAIHHAGDHPATQWGDVTYMPGYRYDVPNADIPIIVPGVDGASQIAVARTHACAIVGQGQVQCWGASSPSRYALGLGGIHDDWNRIYEQPPGSNGHHVYDGFVEHVTINETDDYNDPNAYTQHGVIDRVVQLDVGRNHSCAVRDDGRVWCWGDNEAGQIGNIASHYGHLDDKNTFRIGYALQVPDVVDAVQVSTGQAHSCARHDDGRVSCWGDNEFGQLGDGTRFNRRNHPQFVVGIDDAVHVSAGDRQTCAVRADGDVACWGEVHSDLPPGVPRAQTQPFEVSGLLFDAEHVDTYGNITCAVGEGQLACWVLSGALYGHDGSPSLVAGVEDAVEVAAGIGHACVRRESGTLLCMGNNHDGQLGDGTKQWRPGPVPVVVNPL